jgi:multicomponent Na+:H+ antiporter subunit D
MMEALLASRPLLAVLVSALAAVAIAFSGRRPNLREGWTLAAAFLKFGLVFSMLPQVLEGNYPELTLLQISPGIELALRVDPAGIIFALSASFLWVLTSFYAMGYMRGLDEHKQTRFFAMLATCLSATIGLCFSANLLTFVLFYEILSVATYPLVIHKESEKAYRIGRQYLVYAITAGIALVAGSALIHQMAGTLDFQAGGFLTAEMGRGPLMAVFLLFFLGFGVKGGVMPLHSWLPNAMIAPTPVSALLHAVAVVKAGVFGFVRLSGYVFGPELLHALGFGMILAALAGGTILLASLIAMTKDDLKARLAYSTVGHLSYIVLGVALLAPTAFLGGMFHMVTHAAMKITLFFCAGAIYVHTGLDRVSQLDGIGRKMPITMAAFGIGTLGLAGVPLIGGFLSKWYLATGTVDAGELVFLAVLLVSGALNLVYLLPVVTRAFFRSSPEHTGMNEASAFMVVPLVVTALLSISLGVNPDGFFHFFTLAGEVVGSVMGGAAEGVLGSGIPVEAPPAEAVTGGAP